MTKKLNLREAEKVALRLISSAQTCYNPECDEPLLTIRNGTRIVNHDIAHIRDELPPKDKDSDIGWRYFPDDLSQEERNTMSNFVMLCRPCHKLIDKLKPRDYSVELLHDWKAVAEEGNKEDVYEEPVSPEDLLDKIQELLEAKPSQDQLFDASMITSATSAHNPIATPKTFPNLPSEVSPDLSITHKSVGSGAV